MAVKERKIDAYQKKAIEAINNTVVSAGAGSGKTTVLSERFSNLVLVRGFGVDEILTLTYTKKATVEMSSRIYKVLRQKDQEKAKDFYKANIRTIDSYCSSIAKMGAHYYGIAPDFAQDEISIAHKVEDLALPFILKYRDNNAIKTLVTTSNYDAVAKALFVNPVLTNSSVVNPIDFDSEINHQKEEIVKIWAKQSSNVENIIAALENIVKSYQGNSLKIINTLSEWLQKNELLETPALTIEQIEKADCSELKKWLTEINEVSRVNLNVGKASCGEELKELINSLRKIIPVIISLINYVRNFTLVTDVIPLLKEFQNKVNNLKRETGLLSFKDISELAAKTLCEHPEIRQIEKKKYKAIMIDEFQDDNLAQKEMLFMLAEKPERMEKGVPEVKDLCPDKLFFVGDEKQSIYRFRGADVSVFRAMSDEFKGGNLSMSTNYRSTQALISSFNTIFGGIKYPCKDESEAGRPSVFYNEEDEKKGTSIPSYEAVYHEVTLSEDAAEEVKNTKDKNSIYRPHIHIARYFNEHETEDAQIVKSEAEAEWIADKITEITTNGINGKKYLPSDIAILFKSKTYQSIYERVLLNHGIPFDAEVITAFFADGPVNDIISFLKLCIYDDEMAYAQVLRSPFVNLSAEETDALLFDFEKPFSKEAEQILSEQSLLRYQNAGALFDELKLCIKNEPLTKIITKLWYETGYRYETLWNRKVSAYSKMYDFLFELARQSEQESQNISQFIDNVLYYRSKALENMNIPVEQNDGVHLMTIHKSKGLEFKIVFICGSQGTGQRDSNTDTVFYSKENGITINYSAEDIYKETNVKMPSTKTGVIANYFYNRDVQVESAKETAELRRVTYVALTRAIDELYITNGSYTVPKESAYEYLPGGNKEPKSIYQVLSPIIEYYENPDVKEMSPFDFEEIPAYERRTYSSEGNLRNTQQQKVSLLEKLNIDGEYENAPVIQKEQIEPKYATPSQLHSPDEETQTDSGQLVQVKDVPYKRINEIIMSTIPKWNKEVSAEQPKPKFDFTHFGTIAHAHMEAAVKKEEVRISNRDIVGLENSSEKLEEIKQICLEMQHKFIECELGQKAINSKWHKAEYSFRSKVSSKIIKGIIDLVFENDDGSYTIVDYKTNQEMKPEVYYNQLACYRQAVSQMLNVDPQNVYCSLYYLRFGKAVDITQECSRVDVEKIVGEQSFMANT